MVAGLEVLPALSFTVYSMGVGSVLKPTSGVNVTSPVLESTVQTPSPGMLTG